MYIYKVFAFFVSAVPPLLGLFGLVAVAVLDCSADKWHGLVVVACRPICCIICYSRRFASEMILNLGKTCPCKVPYRALVFGHNRADPRLI